MPFAAQSLDDPEPYSFPPITIVSDMFSGKPWTISKIPANRSINSNSQKRTGHFELLIKNY